MRYLPCLLAIILMLLGPGVSGSQSSIDYLELEARQGEGIYQLLRRSGLIANRAAYNAFKNINTARLKGEDALLPHVSYMLPIIVVTHDEAVDVILQKLGVLDHREAVHAFNIKHNPGYDPDQATATDRRRRLYVPELTSGYYDGGKDIASIPSPDDGITGTDVKQVSSGIEGPSTKPYPELKGEFKKASLGNELRDVCFVLDAGHGGNDPGTNPHVLRGDGIEAHAFEAPLVYDTTLRLMKHIILHGGEVFLTHYAPDFGIRDIKNPSQYSTQKYNMSDKDIRTDQPAGSIRERKLICGRIIARNLHKGRKVVFMSIHADYIPNKKTDLPIKFFYHQTTAQDAGASRTFARNMAQAVTGSRDNVKAKHLGVLYRNPATLEVLVELANLNNQHGAWRLRDHSYREKLAAKLCGGLVKTLGSETR